MKIHSLYTDGGAFNNGTRFQKARICVVFENEVIVKEEIGNHTNNEAEMIAIDRAFLWIKENIKADDRAVVFSDSKLAVNMITYVWGGQVERLKLLRNQIASHQPRNTVLKWMYRDFNKAGHVLELDH